MAGTRAGEARQAAAQGDARTPSRPGPSTWRKFLEPEKIAAVAVLFWMSGPVAPLIPDLDDSLGTMLSLPASGLAAPAGIDDQVLRLSWYPVYLVVLVLAHRHWQAIWTVAKRNGPLILLLSWTLLSTLWSVSPEDTLRRSMALSLTTTFAIYLGARFDALAVVKLMVLALGIDMIGGALLALAFPAIGICHDAEHPGAWRGVFASKNQLGAMMLIESLGIYVLYIAERRRIYLFGLGAAAALLILSTSKTPLFIVLALVPCLALVGRFFRTPRGFDVLLALALSVAAVVFLVASTMIEPILVFFGRDATLTGRTDIWYLSWDAIQQRYWTGYGYGAFWSNPWGPASTIWDALNWRVPSAHNGLLEMWLAVGLFGVIVFVALLVRSFCGIMSRAAQGTREECLWRVGYFLIFVVHAVTEATAMDQTSVAWALFVAVAVGGSRVGMAARHGRTSAATVAAPAARHRSAASRRSAAGMTIDPVRRKSLAS